MNVVSIKVMEIKILQKMPIARKNLDTFVWIFERPSRFIAHTTEEASRRAMRAAELATLLKI